MLRDNGAFIIFALYFMFFCYRTSSECTQLTPCSCKLENGNTYDLTNLTNLGILKASDSKYSFYFQPCKNAKLTSMNDSECYKGEGVSLCAVNGTGSFSLGSANESKLQLQSGNNKQPSLIFQHGNRTTIMNLSCDPCKTELTVDNVTDYTQFHLKLVSQSMCKTQSHISGLSTGSVLVILFFLFSAVYFIGGAIALKFLRGATGWEMLPNHEFWCELPSLVRDGIGFTFNCCHADSYERI